MVIMDINGWLVVWNHGFFLIFHSVWNFIIPIDELIFFIGIETTNQTTGK